MYATSEFVGGANQAGPQAGHRKRRGGMQAVIVFI